MPRSAPLLAVVAAAALALPPSPSLAQQRGPSRIPPGGPIVPSGRVLAGELPDLIIVSMIPGTLVQCIRPFIGQASFSVFVRNVGKGAAVMPPTMPTLGRYWVGLQDPSIVPGVMPIAAGPPSQLLPTETKLFSINVIVKFDQTGKTYGVVGRVDPANLIFESNENNNEKVGIFTSTKPCQ
jgi:CARDB